MSNQGAPERGRQQYNEVKTVVYESVESVPRESQMRSLRGGIHLHPPGPSARQGAVARTRHVALARISGGWVSTLEARGAVAFVAVLHAREREALRRTRRGA